MSKNSAGGSSNLHFEIHTKITNAFIQYFLLETDLGTLQFWSEKLCLLLPFVFIYKYAKWLQELRSLREGRELGQTTSSNCQWCPLCLTSGGYIVPLSGTTTASGPDEIKETRKATAERGEGVGGSVQASNSNSKYWGSK